MWPRSLSGTYEQLSRGLKRYADAPIPKADLENRGVVGFFVDIVAGPQPHTPPEDFEQLIQLTDQTAESSKQIYTAVEELSAFFAKLNEQFLEDAMNAGWATQLDASNLRERWTRLQEEVDQGKLVIMEGLELISNLADRLCM